MAQRKNRLLLLFPEATPSGRLNNKSVSFHQIYILNGIQLNFFPVFPDNFLASRLTLFSSIQAEWPGFTPLGKHRKTHWLKKYELTDNTISSFPPAIPA
jgi:hypothetical protein